MALPILRTITFVAVFMLCASCNIYAPFQTESDTQDFIEEALACEHDGDFACAIENYSQIPEEREKVKRLCTGYLAKSGLTLSIFLNTVTKSTTNMLGTLANRLAPWDATKGSDSANALINCFAFSERSDAGNLGPLLRAVGAFTDCAIRMSKTDIFVATSNDDTACDTPASGDGNILQADIATADGSISSAEPGMCKADVIECTRIISAVNNNELGNAGLLDLVSVLNALPESIKTEATDATIDIARQAIRGQAPAS